MDGMWLGCGGFVLHQSRVLPYMMAGINLAMPRCTEMNVESLIS